MKYPLEGTGIGRSSTRKQILPVLFYCSPSSTGEHGFALLPHHKIYYRNLQSRMVVVKNFEHADVELV